jgi:Leucine-rich repeat (LRR) protein
MSDAAIVAQLAAGRPVVELAHARQRIDGSIGVLWRDGAAQVICAHRCQLAGLPVLAGLDQLVRLDVGGNQLRELPALPAALRELYVYDNQLVRLPALPRLSVLDANRNQLVELPALDGIDFVYLAANRLGEPPVVRGARYLNLGNNPLGELALAGLADPALQELRVEQAQLRAVVPARLAGLRELSLRTNQLRELPAAIGELSGLRTLDLRDNQLDELPEAVRHLALDKLDLRWNPLRARPAWLVELAARGCRIYV